MSKKEVVWTAWKPRYFMDAKLVMEGKVALDLEEYHEMASDIHNGIDVFVLDCWINMMRRRRGF